MKLTTHQVNLPGFEKEVNKLVVLDSAHGVAAGMVRAVVNYQSGWQNFQKPRTDSTKAQDPDTG